VSLNYCSCADISTAIIHQGLPQIIYSSADSRSRQTTLAVHHQAGGKNKRNVSVVVVDRIRLSLPFADFDVASSALLLLIIMQQSCTASAVNALVISVAVTSIRDERMHSTL
jgi:hypothetical protein